MVNSKTAMTPGWYSLLIAHYFYCNQLTYASKNSTFHISLVLKYLEAALLRTLKSL